MRRSLLALAVLLGCACNLHHDVLVKQQADLERELVDKVAIASSLNETRRAMDEQEQKLAQALSAYPDGKLPPEVVAAKPAAPASTVSPVAPLALPPVAGFESSSEKALREHIV